MKSLVLYLVGRHEPLRFKIKSMVIDSEWITIEGDHDLLGRFTRSQVAAYCTSAIPVPVEADIDLLHSYNYPGNIS